MKEVYLVYRMYHEYVYSTSHTENEDMVEKVFTTEDKAIDYICERIKRDHEYIGSMYPGDDDFTKYEPVRSDIRKSVAIDNWEMSDDYVNKRVSYRYESYDLE